MKKEPQKPSVRFARRLAYVLFWPASKSAKGREPFWKAKEVKPKKDD